MRPVLILGILGLSALVFYTAVQTNTNAADARFQALSAELAQEQSTLAEQSAAKVSKLETQLASFGEQEQALKAKLADAEAKAAKLAELETENSGLSETVASLQSKVQALGAVEADKAELASANTALQAELETLRTASLNQDDLIAENKALSEDIVKVRSEMAAQKTDLIATNEALSEKVAGLQSELTTLQEAEPSEQLVAQAVNDTLLKSNEEKQALEQTVADLQAALDATAAEVSNLDAKLKTETTALQALLDEKAAALTDANTQIATLTESSTAQSVDADNTSELEAELASLREGVAMRDLAIVELRDQLPPAGSADLSQCQARTEETLSSGGIAFQAGTTGLADSATPQLSVIADVVLDCAQNGLVLEIEGHTDSEGGVASNLLLSNGRAKAIYDFLLAQGVPATAMRAVGFGKSDPIADSATADGRAKNERIVFDWEQS